MITINIRMKKKNENKNGFNEREKVCIKVFFLSLISMILRMMRKQWCIENSKLNK